MAYERGQHYNAAGTDKVWYGWVAVPDAAVLADKAALKPQESVMNSTEPLLSILLQRITAWPFQGYFMATHVPELPTSANDYWRIEYKNVSGDDYEVMACRVWGDDRYTRRMNHYAKVWKGEWVKQATATPPQEYALPLAAGCREPARNEAKTVYSKAQDGLVVLHYFIGRDAGAAFEVGDRTIANIPAGYRPGKAVVGWSGTIKITAEGENLIATVPTTGVTIIAGTLTYYAD